MNIIDNNCPVCEEKSIVIASMADGTISYCTTKGCRFVYRTDSEGFQVSIGENEVKSRNNGSDNYEKHAWPFIEAHIEVEKERMKIVKADNARAKLAFEDKLRKVLNG